MGVRRLPIRPAFSGMPGTRTGNFACPPQDLEEDVVKAGDWWLIMSPQKSWKHFSPSYVASDGPSQTLSMTVCRAGSVKETGTTQRQRYQDFTLVLVTHSLDICRPSNDSVLLSKVASKSLLQKHSLKLQASVSFIQRYRHRTPAPYLQKNKTKQNASWGHEAYGDAVGQVFFRVALFT